MVISFRGKLKAGKSTLRSLVKEELTKRGYPVKNVSYAEALKVEVYDLYRTLGGTNPDPGTEWRSKDEMVAFVNEHKDFFRPLLQWYGTEFRRGQDDLYWVKRLDYQIDDDVINMVDDCRFPNEYEALEKHPDFIDVFIERPGFEGDGHASETSLGIYKDTVVIKNDGTLDGLGAAASLIVDIVESLSCPQATA